VALVGAGVVVARGTGAAEPIVERSGAIVTFSGSDPITGKPVSLDDYDGKPVVINVWGSWCPGCIAEAEDLRRFGEDHPEVQLIGVDLQDTKGQPSSTSAGAGRIRASSIPTGRSRSRSGCRGRRARSSSIGSTES